MTPKTSSEIRLMEKAGYIAAEALTYTGKHVKKGITTNELDKIALDFIHSKGAKSACLGYRGYPKSICTSVNHVICHGVPDKTILKNGDIINIDITVIYSGFHGDTSRMFFVGKVNKEAKKLCDCAFKAMHKGIQVANSKSHVGDIGFAIDKFTTRNGYFTVKELGGHGIGKNFHEDPFVPSFGKKGRGEKLVKWGTITVEPMINETNVPVKEILIDGSEITVFETGDKTLSAQYEHTILITDKEPKILTKDD